MLSDSKGLVVHGAEGAIIDGRFRILSIGAESIEIAYADGRGRQTLRLSGPVTRRAGERVVRPGVCKGHRRS